MYKTVLITGASKGIGASTAEYFAKQGNYNVVINYKSSVKKAEELKAKLDKLPNSSIMLAKADITDIIQVKNMVAAILNKYNKIDIVINNAGLFLEKFFIDTTTIEQNDLINTNIYGPINVCREVIPYFLKQKSGSIVNVSSISGLSGNSCEAVYSLTKSAIIGFTKALAKELACANIRVNCVAPGATNTEMMANYSKEELTEYKKEIPLNRLAEPSEIAEAIYYIANATYCTGQVLSPNGGISI